MYSNTVKSSAKMITQILDTSLLCKKVAFNRMNEVPIENITGGPNSIISEVNETIS